MTGSGDLDSFSAARPLMAYVSNAAKRKIAELWAKHPENIVELRYFSETRGSHTGRDRTLIAWEIPGSSGLRLSWCITREGEFGQIFVRDGVKYYTRRFSYEMTEFQLHTLRKYFESLDE